MPVPYQLASRNGDDPQPASQTSTGPGNVATTVVAAEANGVWICAETIAARVTFDGSTPSATNGLVIPAGAAPQFFPIQGLVSLKHESASAGNSVLHTLQVE